MTMNKTIILVSILVFGCSSIAGTSLYNFDLIAKQTTFSLFDNVETEAKKENTQNKETIDTADNDDIKIQWIHSSDSTNNNKESNNKTILFENATNDEKYNNIDTNTENDETLLDWFEVAHEPEVLKNRKSKTDFRKNDPYYGKHLCNNGQYSCISIKKGDSWKSLFPNKYHRELVQRINRTNRGLWNRNWILVPNDVNKDYMDFSPLPYYYNTNGKKTIIIDISELAFGAYDSDGDLVHWGPVNPGKEASQTVRGENFQVYRKGGAECWSKKYESYIPYCMFFHKGFALHGYAMPGYPASHGCVRTYVDDALWLNKNFADYQTRVIVQD